MEGILIKRNNHWLVEFTTDLGAPNILPLYPEDESNLSKRCNIADLVGAAVEFNIVQYNTKGSAYINSPYSTYAMLKPGSFPSVLLAELRSHLRSITPEQLNQEIDEIRKGLDLDEMEQKLDTALANETSKTFTEWLQSKRQSITLKERVVGVLKYHSVKTKDGYAVEESDWNNLADSLISCFEQFGPKTK